MTQKDLEFRVLFDTEVGNNQYYIEERKGLFGGWRAVKISFQKKLYFATVDDAVHWIEHDVRKRYHVQIHIDKRHKH